MAEIILTAPSLLAADFACLREQIKQIEGSADWLHFDVMDGHFVDNLSFGAGIAANIRSFSDIPQDVHLMVEHPLKFIPQFVKAGASSITVHIEAKDNAEECLDLIHSYGIKAAVSLNPDTPADAVYHLKGKADMVLQMTVFPGFGGQALIESAFENLRQLRKYFGEGFLLQADGGINLSNYKQVIEAGANVIVAGTAVFHSENPAEVCRKLKE